MPREEVGTTVLTVLNHRVTKVGKDLPRSSSPAFEGPNSSSAEMKCSSITNMLSGHMSRFNSEIIAWKISTRKVERGKLPDCDGEW